MKKKWSLKTHSEEWWAQCRAADALKIMGPKAKAAVPELHQVLKSELAGGWLRSYIIDALAAIGPDALPAVPEIAASFEEAMRIWDKKEKIPGREVVEMLRAIKLIDKTATEIPGIKKLGELTDAQSGDLYYDNIPTAFFKELPKIREALKKKYGDQKP